MSAQPQGFTQGSVRAGAQATGAAGPRKAAKPFFMMSEFLAFLALTAALAIAAAVDDDLRANLIWPLITLLGFAYILSRGLAKRGGGDSSDLR